MPKTIEIEVFQFDELSDKAKETARDWLRGLKSEDSDWFEQVYDDADTIAALLGIEINRKHAKSYSGRDLVSPAIYFSGFSSQGDGACFEGGYAYAKGGAAKVKAYAPEDKALHAIADTLQAVQRAHGYTLTASVAQSGHYYHSRSTTIDVETASGKDVDSETDEVVKQALRDFMDWIYAALRAEDEWRLSAEVIDDDIRANEYAFDVNGKRNPYA